MELFFLIYMGIGVVVAVIFIFSEAQRRKDVDLADKLLMVVLNGVFYAAIWPICALTLLKKDR